MRLASFTHCRAFKAIYWLLYRTVVFREVSILMVVPAPCTCRLSAFTCSSGAAKAAHGQHAWPGQLHIVEDYQLAVLQAHSLPVTMQISRSVLPSRRAGMDG
jgi:hypothetical protein